MISVTNTVRVYERDGQELGVSENEFIVVQSHSIRQDTVTLNINDGKNGRKSVAVLARDLKAAIDNATNTVR